MNGLTTDQEFTDEARASGERYVWECAVGGRSAVIVPSGGDFPMRQAVEKAFFDLTGQHPEMCYSGWGRKFTDKAVSGNTPVMLITTHTDGETYWIPGDDVADAYSGFGQDITIQHFFAVPK